MEEKKDDYFDLEEPIKASSILYYARFLNTKFIVSIVGIMLLIVGVYAGIQLVLTQQLLQKKAASDTECEESQNCIFVGNPLNQDSFEGVRPISYITITSDRQYTLDAPGEENECYIATMDGPRVAWETKNTCPSISSIQIWIREETPATTTPEISAPSTSCPDDYTQQQVFNGGLARQNSGVSLPWTISHDFSVTQDSETILSVWSSVGHPEKGCQPGPENDNGKDSCDGGQNFEEFDIYLDGQLLTRVPDHGEDKWQFYSNVGPQTATLSANPHNITFQHTNDGTTAESVVYLAALCTKVAAPLTAAPVTTPIQVTSPLPPTEPTIVPYSITTETPASPTLEPAAPPSATTEPSTIAVTTPPSEEPIIPESPKTTQVQTPTPTLAGKPYQKESPQAKYEPIAISLPEFNFPKLFGFDFDLLIFLVKLFAVTGGGTGRG